MENEQVKNFYKEGQEPCCKPCHDNIMKWHQGGCKGPVWDCVLVFKRGCATCGTEVETWKIENEERILELLVAIRETIFDDCYGPRQCEFVSSPLSVFEFANEWIKRAKGLPYDKSWFIK